MKRNLAIYFLLAGMMFFLSEAALAERPKHRGPVKGGAQPSKITVQNQFTLTGNNWAFECTNYGSYAQDVGGRLPNSGGSGGEFPRGTETYIIYAAGIQVGAMVNGVPHVSMVDFDSEFEPGPLQKANPYDTTEVPVPDDPGSAINKLFALDGGFQDGTPLGTNGDATDDYANWPAQYGAPVDRLGKPLVIGDLMSWCVFNDMDPARHVIPDNSQKEPLGLEIQQTSIQVNIAGYSDVFFMYYKLINKGTKNLNDVYVSAWFDADVDKSSNDLVATDTAANMVFTYNSDNTDPKSGGGSAYGADFFQGPVVPGEPTDTAKYLELTPDGFIQQIVPGKKVMGLSTTVRYINVRGPDGDPDNDAELYNLMQGKEKNGDPKPSRWAYPDDPITGSVLDPRPDDKRMMLVTGPFNLSVGDTQLVVLACIGGKGSDRIDAIKNLRITDDIAQKAYDAAFVLPQPPTSPNLSVTGLDNRVTIEWDNLPELGADFYPENARLTIPGYERYDFAGYKLYKSTDEGITWKVLAQFDKRDGITVIPETTWFIQDSLIKTLRQVPIGDDGGLQYSYIDEDVIVGKEYRYAVTAYDAQPNVRSGAAPVTLESAISRNAVRVIPRAPTLGNSYGASAPGTAEHTGPSAGTVLVSVIDPLKITGHVYKLYFEDLQIVDTTIADTSHRLVWRLYDSTAASLVKFFKADDPRTDVDESMFQDRQASASDPGTIQEFVTADGMKIQVFGPSLDFADFLIVANGSGALDPPEYGAFAFNSSGFPHPSLPDNDRPGANSQVGDGEFGIHTADNGARSAYTAFVSRTARDGDNWPEIIPFDFEIRFTAAGGWAYDAFNTGTNSFQVPFELWNIGIGTPNDPSDDYRMIPWLLDDDSSLTFNMGGPDAKSSGTYDHTISGGSNDPYTDWIYWARPASPTPGQAGYLAAEAAMQAGTYDGGTDVEVMARMVLVSVNGDIGETPPSGVYNQDLPETGTIFRIITSKPNSGLDTFTIRSSAPPAFDATSARSRLNKQNIKIVPNPYYGFSAYDNNQFNRRVKITGLPAECTIRIFNVAGDLIRTIDHNAGSNNDRSSATSPEFTSIEVWDLTSNSGLFVSSGMYFIHIDAPGIGKSEELIPFAIIQGNIQLTVPTN